MGKIDIVYTYVDGSDSNWLQKKSLAEQKYFGKTTSASNSARFMDNQEIKYSLRSIEKFAPWVNKIFIVTDNQIPDWLNINNAKLQIIDHKEIFSKEEYLPNFNAKAIETQIHHIKDLSEHFIYFNDDMFLGRNTSPEDFFDKDGNPKIFVSEFIALPNKKVFDFDSRNENKKNDYQESVIKTRILFKNHFGKNIYYNIRHGVKPLLKSVLYKLESLFPNEIDFTAKNKFRTGSDLMMFHLCQFYCLGENIGKAVYLHSIDHKNIFKKLFFNKRKNSFYFVNLDNSNLELKLNYLLDISPFVMCLNQTPNTPDENLLFMKNFLQKYFPDKSEFEK